jgi:hypothetical protein
MKNKEILANSSLVGHVKKRGENYKIWSKRIIITTNNYVYFYRGNNDLVYEY